MSAAHIRLRHAMSLRRGCCCNCSRCALSGNITPRLALRPVWSAAAERRRPSGPGAAGTGRGRREHRAHAPLSAVARLCRLRLGPGAQSRPARRACWNARMTRCASSVPSMDARSASSAGASAGSMRANSPSTRRRWCVSSSPWARRSPAIRARRTPGAFTSSPAATASTRTIFTGRCAPRRPCRRRRSGARPTASSHGAAASRRGASWRRTSSSSSSHLGLGAHPAALYAIADRLAQPEGHWEPFHREGWRRLVYRDPHEAASEARSPRAARSIAGPRHPPSNAR